MKKKLLNGILIVLGVIVLLWMAFPFGMIIALAFWVYIGVIFAKRKHVFPEDIEPEEGKKQLKRLKKLIIASGIFFIIAVVGIILHNVKSGLAETEESLYFFTGIIALYLFILA